MNYHILDDRDYRDRSFRGERERDSDRGREDNREGHGSSKPPSNSLFAEMLKKKNNRALLEQKKRDTSVIVNSELSDPRNPSMQRQLSAPVASNLTQQPDPRYSMAIAAANGQTMPPNLIKKGPKAPPHRPGALPMPPGMDIRRMLDDTAHSSSLNDSSKRKSSILVRVIFGYFQIS